MNNLPVGALHATPLQMNNERNDAVSLVANPRHPSKSASSAFPNQQFNKKITIMKKLLFLFFLPLWGFGGIAHASVTVQVLATDFPNKQVTLRVEYVNAVNDRAWVWIYLCSMQGMFQPAEISAASATSGSVLYLSTNTRGFFVTASPATITATLSNAPDPFSCCAYGSDTPPNMMESNGTYTFKGTPPFILTDACGTTTQTVTEKTLPASALTFTPVFITDETGYPVVSCPYTGCDLFIDATHLCQKLTIGAKNWEAYIIDSRDSEIYRITQFSDNSWWFAEDYRGSYGYERTCGAKRFYSATDKANDCPAGWALPSQAAINARYNNSNARSDQWNGPLINSVDYINPSNPSCLTTAGRCDLICSDRTTAIYHSCVPSTNGADKTPGSVRCRRQL
jgi:hypothetical protein